jgi:tetratricopeptide (TPR) repeat protein
MASMDRWRLVRRFLSFIFIWASAAGWGAAENPEKWVEVSSPHFKVMSDAGEREARRIAGSFEEIRAALKGFLPRARIEPGKPVFIIAVKNEKGLRSLLPEFWEKKGQSRPAGIFQSGPDKHFVVLRTDIRDEDAYQIVYHEYLHLLLNLNFKWLPLWLSEGLAEFYANTTVREKEVLLGRPDKYHVWLLRDSSLLPLPELFAADQSSPLYNEQNKITIFYAQSWALIHYFMLAEGRGERNLLPDLLRLLESAGDEKTATEQAFGDLRRLERELRDYVAQRAFYNIRLKTAVEVSERSFPVRPLSFGESAAVRGSFLAHRNRPREARALLEEALLVDPNQTLALESLGLLHLAAGEREQARQRLARAVALDSQSFLAHYHATMLAMESARSEEDISRVENGLKRAIELNPEFAPAYAALVGFYSTRNIKLAGALSLAQKAVELEPAVTLYQLSLAQIAAQLGHLDEALRLGERVLEQAKSTLDRQLAEDFLRRTRRVREQQERLRVKMKRRKGHGRPKPIASAARPRSGRGMRRQPARPSGSSRPPSTTPSAGSPRLASSSPCAAAWHRHLYTSLGDEPHRQPLGSDAQATGRRPPWSPDHVLRFEATAALQSLQRSILQATRHYERDPDPRPEIRRRLLHPSGDARFRPRILPVCGKASGGAGDFRSGLQRPGARGRRPANNLFPLSARKRDCRRTS